METDLRIETELSNDPARDAQSVSAVRAGDVERYRELVERHERRVFAVAWSRLGDAALAEEAAQEAFIRGYRRLWLLGDGAKFAAWITSITRHTAINLGLRRRRELNKRERWSLEPADTADSSSGEPAGDYTPEMLRETLADLPAAHRECLVLFYLEGRSGAEAAAALGISEPAFRVRLHRARGVLREQLETKLEGSLQKLRPGAAFTPSVMAAVLASSSAKTATAGSAILGGLAKLTPFKGLFFFVPFFMPLVTMIPALVFQRWVARDEMRNYRDPKGFRANRSRGSNALVFILMCLLFTAIFVTAMTSRFLGFKTLFLIIGVFTSAGACFTARLFVINRTRAHLSLFVNFLIQPVFYLLIGFGWLPIAAVILPVSLSSMLAIFTNRSRMLRNDYNLFLRATQGLLALPDEPGRNAASTCFNRPALLAFARFLSERQLIANFHWTHDGLVLYLTAVKPAFANSLRLLFPSTRRNSFILLGWQGNVTARLGRTDREALADFRSGSFSDPSLMESEVAAAVALAWRNYCDANNTLAEQAIGQVPESEIFLKPPAHTRANLWQRIIFGTFMGLAVAAIAIIWLFLEDLSGLKPVNLTESQVRAFLNDTTPSADPKNSRPNDPDATLLSFNSLAIAPMNLYTTDGLRAMRSELFREAGFPDANGPWKGDPSSPCNSPLARQALVNGWIDWSDFGVTPLEVGKYLHQNRANQQILFATEFLLVRERAWSWVDREAWEVQRAGNGTLDQLRWLQMAGCLDLVDREQLIRQIVSVQDLSATAPSGQPTLHDWRDVRGLFFTPCYPALQDTYYSIAALEILGGLDRIDREQCIRGILRRHRGKGFFTSPDSGSFNEYHINGNARDTFSAFETLRILGALDRVPDLDQWKFRPERNGVAKDEITWQDVEAWICQQRLEKILRARKESPKAPVRSLLQP